MNYYALLPLFSSVINLILGFFIIFIDYKKLENRLFFMFNLMIVFWSILHFFMFFADTAKQAWAWGRFDTWTSTFSTIFFLLFMIYYTKFKLSPFLKYCFVFVFLYAIFFSLLDQETFLVEKLPDLHFYGYFSAPGEFYIFPSILVIAGMITGLLLTLRFYRKSTTENEKRQALLLFIALSVPLAGGVITEFIPTMFNIEVIPLTTTLTTFMAVIIGYTIHKYKLLIPLRYEFKKVKEDFEKLFVTFNALPDSVVLLTEQGRILETNNAMDRNFGDSEESLVDKNLYNLLPKKVVDQRKKLIHKTLQTGTTQENEDKIMNRYFYNLFIPTESIGGENNLLIISKDITEQRKAEKERKQLEKQMQQSQKLRSLGTMAGGIAHDFKNILTPILGFSNMALKKMDPSSTSYIYIEEINNAAQRAKEIIDQILRFSRESETKKKPVNLKEITEETLKLLQSFVPLNIKINVLFGKSCDKVLADPTQIHEVITNLCTNAVHAMEEKGGVLEIRLDQELISKDELHKSPDLKEQAYVRITISDTGIGMTREVKERIFDPFFTTKEIDKGTGLGLSVVHGIIKEHQGAITVSSKKGMGSVFRIYLPVLNKG